ncbi:MAG: GGDEF and EAL domain-containing protein [Roseiarcus sp.]
MGSIGDIALEKALPFDAANSGAACSSADADSVSILTTIDAVVYDWDIATDRLTWSSNVGTTLAGFASTALATGAGFAARITCDSESSRFQVVHNGPARDEGQGVPFRVSYRMASSQGAIYEVDDFGRWFADGAGRPCRVHGVLRVLSRAPSAQPDADWPSVSLVEGTFCSRRAFNEMVDQRCGQAAANIPPFAVLIVGFDDLPGINRRNGYDAADELIAAVGRRLTASLRAGDRIARHAGGKFAILISLATTDQLSTATYRLVRRLNGETFPTSAGPLPASVRIGAALAPRNGRNAHLLLQRADEALEIAREAADRHASYSASLARGESRRRETRIADDIAAALKERRVVLAFQPIVPTIGGRVGFEEALVRIRQDDGSLLGAMGLIPVAEKLGLIEQIDQRVLELTLERLSVDPMRRLSMNVSIATLRARDWLDRLKAALRNVPGAAERLIVEIVETQAIDDIPETIRVLRAMKALGVRIAMDDFGSRHTSFRDLRSLGVDMVKIDGAFIQNLAGSLNDRFFVRTLASLARHIEFETVAKWVEDMEAARLLTEWGVDYLQGDVIGRALTPDATETEIRLARIGRTMPDH